MIKYVLLFCFFLPYYSFGQTSDFIHIDQFGYKSHHTKVAVISNPQIGFNSGQSFSPSTTLEVRNASNNAVVFSGSISVWNNGATHSQSGDKGWWFDFSEVSQNGNYYIYDVANDEKSAVFTINDNVYNSVLKTATKVFYYNRCGIAKTLPYVLNGFTDPISFTQDENTRDITQQNNTNTTKDMRGGWYDAGDYNKYVTFAEAPVHDLLWAYQDNPTVFDDNFNIPESGNGIPDIIDELKWELDWLLKMINTDGSVHIKMGARSHDENSASPPSVNSEIRYYAPTCTSASLAASSMLAHASKVFSQFSSLTTYAQTLKDQALLTWNFVEPRIENASLEINCDDLSVVSGDADRTLAEQQEMALSAAIYLFDLTNDDRFQQYIDNHLNDVNFDDIWDNYHLKTIDALLYFTSLANASTPLKNRILNAARTTVSNNFNNYFQFNDLDLYRAYANDWAYHWGSNIQKSNFGNLNFVHQKYQINTSTNSSFTLRAKEHLHYFHGVNPLGLVYLSNMNNFGAEKSANQIYHLWFTDGSIWDDALSSTYGPAPGYVPGGSNSFYDADTSLSPPYNQPLQKSYLNFNSNAGNSWEITEPSITNQAAYIRLLSQVIALENDGALAVNDFELNNLKLSLIPNPIYNSFKIIAGTSREFTISIYNVRGQVFLKNKVIRTNEEVTLNTLKRGVYFLKVKSERQFVTLKIIKN